MRPPRNLVALLAFLLLATGQPITAAGLEDRLLTVWPLLVRAARMLEG